VKTIATARRVKVSADGRGVVSHAGMGLLRELADATGLSAQVIRHRKGRNLQVRARDRRRNDACCTVLTQMIGANNGPPRLVSGCDVVSPNVANDTGMTFHLRRRPPGRYTRNKQAAGGQVIQFTTSILAPTAW
jgi:hypothetical protein